MSDVQASQQNDFTHVFDATGSDSHLQSDFSQFIDGLGENNILQDGAPRNLLWQRETDFPSIQSTESVDLTFGKPYMDFTAPPKPRKVKWPVLTPMCVGASATHDIQNWGMLPPVLPPAAPQVLTVNQNGDNGVHAGRRQATGQDWNRLRPIIVQLYVTENKTLENIMALMRDSYDFKAT